jgi:methylmalonyl-CoA mutase C-terminal domain/subunit
VPQEDLPALKAAGVREIFTPGTSTERVVEWVQANIRPRRL